MSKKYKNNNYNNYKNTNEFNINIEELKGIKVKINNENNKYLIVYPSDVNFIIQVEDLVDYITKAAEKIAENNTDIESLSSEEKSEILTAKLNLTKDLIKNCKEKFNNVFNDSTAYERIFGNVVDIHLMVLVINKVYEYVLSLRESENHTMSKYTEKYDK